ncbi:hypothetical protein L596_013513 [Steinernema carpocapsae]|nr:hypothetical protein L596_013513 [Steinernema carpocapsae]
MYENAVSGFNDEVKSVLQETQKRRGTVDRSAVTVDRRPNSLGNLAQFVGKKPCNQGLVVSLRVESNIKNQEGRCKTYVLPYVAPLPVKKYWEPTDENHRASDNQILTHVPYSETTLNSSASGQRLQEIDGGLKHGEHGQTSEDGAHGFR